MAAKDIGPWQIGEYRIVYGHSLTTGQKSYYVYVGICHDPLSQHGSLASAKDAVKRYQAGDKRRRTVRRSGADIINDLAR